MIANMGHEIGYHYETLDKAKGNYEKAITIFENELSKFREIAEIKTICMHGNPLTKWLNRDLWSRYDFKDFGIIGEAFLSFEDIAYFSDTGRTWADKYKVKDYIPSDEACGEDLKKRETLKCTDDLVSLIGNGNQQTAYILTHPERWSNGIIGWIMGYSKDMAVNLGKKVIMFVR